MYIESRQILAYYIQSLSWGIIINYMNCNQTIIEKGYAYPCGGELEKIVLPTQQFYECKKCGNKLTFI